MAGVSAVSAELHAKHDEVNGESGGVSSAAVVGNGSAWESKLSDVVKGVAKIGKSHSQAAQKPFLNGPPVVSSMAAVVAPPSKASLDQNPLPNGDLAQSTLALTPPTSPGKKDRAAPFPPAAAAVTAPKAAAAAAATTATGDAAQSKAVMAPPSVSYAKMAEQSKERLEQLAREVKERELEQERERRREAARLSQTSTIFFSYEILNGMVVPKYCIVDEKYLSNILIKSGHFYLIYLNYIYIYIYCLFN